MLSNLSNLLNLSGFVKILYVKKYFLIPCSEINSQSPDVQELAHLGISQLSRLSVNIYVKSRGRHKWKFSRYPVHIGTQNFFPGRYPVPIGTQNFFPGRYPVPIGTQKFFSGRYPVPIGTQNFFPCRYPVPRNPESEAKQELYCRNLGSNSNNRSHNAVTKFISK